MHFFARKTAFSSLCVLTIFAPLTCAVSIVGYTRTASCGGSFFQCSQIAEDACCVLPAGFGNSLEFFNLPNVLPAIAYGVGFGDGDEPCAQANALFYAPGIGTRCWNGEGIRSAASASWITGRSASDSVAVKATSGTDCVAPSLFSYADDKGQTREIAVANQTASEAIAQLYSKGDFVALAAFK